MTADSTVQYPSDDPTKACESRCLRPNEPKAADSPETATAAQAILATEATKEGRASLPGLRPGAAAAARAMEASSEARAMIDLFKKVKKVNDGRNDGEEGAKRGKGKGGGGTISETHPPLYAGNPARNSA